MHLALTVRTATHYANIFFLSCDNSVNTNSDEVDSALSDFYWTVQSGSSSNEIINDITREGDTSIEYQVISSTEMLIVY